MSDAADMSIPLSEQAEAVRLYAMAKANEIELIDAKLFANARAWPLDDFERRKKQLVAMEAAAETLERMAGLK